MVSQAAPEKSFQNQGEITDYIPMPKSAWLFFFDFPSAC